MLSFANLSFSSHYFRPGFLIIAYINVNHKRFLPQAKNRKAFQANLLFLHEPSCRNVRHRWKLTVNSKCFLFQSIIITGSAGEFLARQFYVLSSVLRLIYSSGGFHLPPRYKVVKQRLLKFLNDLINIYF